MTVETFIKENNCLRVHLETRTIEGEPVGIQSFTISETAKLRILESLKSWADFPIKHIFISTCPWHNCPSVSIEI